MPPSPTTDRFEARFQGGARVAVLIPLALPEPYDYRVPDGMALGVGDIVTVPLGPRSVRGVVWGAGVGDIEDAKLREVEGIVDAPALPAQSVAFAEWVARYTLQPLGTVLRMIISVPAALDPPKAVTAYALTQPMPDIRMTPARTRVVEVLAEGPPRMATELAREAATGTGVVKGLLDQGAVMKVDIAPVDDIERPDPTRPGPTLSPDQATAAEALVAGVSSGGYQTTLLDGVPGSGKTEVYFEAVAATLAAGRQALVLLPEIALSAQWLARFEARFGAPPVEWHSDLTGATRRRNWRAVAEGRAPIVVGARSALFLPYSDLGLIVVDEEHDGAYKQEDGVVYNARDMAVVRAHLGGIPIVLASATPSLESVVNAERARYDLLHLPARHAGAELPEVEIADMLKAPPPRGRWLSPRLAEQLTETLGAGRQALLFLNRRGYAPLTLCRKCGYRFQCPRCTAWLVEHRLAGYLQCHHCGFSIRPPAACPECETADSLTACGPGVERLAEEIETLVPGVRLAIAASDNLQGPRAAAEFVRRIEDHEIDVIIGTQIVAKGYHFPLLTLVGVVDADLGLQGGDLRAAERTYQLLYQVAGRAGRGETPGRVVLQTYLADHPVMAALASGDRGRFLEVEREARERAAMPPFGRLVALIVSGRDEVMVDDAARALAHTAPSAQDVRVLGPAPAPIALLRGRHRRRFLLKADAGTNVQAVTRSWLARARWPKSVRVQVDVDPMSFL